ncbi:MAG: ATP phosphoribosyltransferase regulatory subunit [Notoacmeibacter sp.]|nr:ATP phosphoribosyltransferase regulatory subunit [Notoacmeibacter sp.]
MTPRYPATADSILALFASRGAQVVDVPVIQPADPFLDMAGEDLRRRIFLTESETGESLCLRPEFTIPVCMQHIAANAHLPRRYAYLGEVFRQRRAGGSEFFQAGIEDLGDPAITEADARSLADATALIALLLPGYEITTTLGDQAVFEAVLAALGLPRGWQMRLARAFGMPDQLKAALGDLSNGKTPSPLDGELAGLVDARDEAGLAAHIERHMDRTGLSPNAGRTPQEIAHRLIEKAELASVHLSVQAMGALQDFLAIHVPLGEATAALESFATRAAIAIGPALEDFAARVAAIAGHGVDPATVSYDAAFGRPLDYYTGLVFEIAARGNRQTLAGGGRYDRLLTLLGARTPIAGVGFSVWLDRIEAARGTTP